MLMTATNRKRVDLPLGSLSLGCLTQATKGTSK
jgi:hypothetical protein